LRKLHKILRFELAKFLQILGKVSMRGQRWAIIALWFKGNNRRMSLMIWDILNIGINAKDFTLKRILYV